VVADGQPDQPLPVGFSITPYQDDSPAEPASMRPRRDWLRIGARLIAAGLAVGAAWGPVLVQTNWIPGPDGDAHSGGYVRFTFNGWGQAAVRTSERIDFGIAPINGPNFGVLLCVAAAALLLAAVTDWLPGRFRRQPTGRLLVTVTVPFLLAVLLCQILTALRYRPDTLFTDVRIGWSPWLAAAGCLLAALSCLPWPIRRNPVTDVPAGTP
jgi:hypothetical protein